jgi:hypothetical protein
MEHTKPQTSSYISINNEVGLGIYATGCNKGYPQNKLSPYRIFVVLPQFKKKHEY